MSRNKVFNYRKFKKKVNIHINSVKIHFFHFCLLNLMKNSVYEKEKGAYIILKHILAMALLPQAAEEKERSITPL